MISAKEAFSIQIQTTCLHVAGGRALIPHIELTRVSAASGSPAETARALPPATSSNVSAAPATSGFLKPVIVAKARRSGEVPGRSPRAAEGSPPRHAHVAADAKC